MATRSNALSEIARFWLQERHKLFLRESIPVRVKNGNSDIDFVVTTPEESVTLLERITFKNAIVEVKDERDADKHGTSFAKWFCYESKLLQGRMINEETKCYFSMLKKQHHDKAEKIFNGTKFSKVFIFHNLNSARIEDHMIDDLRCRDIHVVTSFEMLADIQNFFKIDHPGSGVRNSLVGDILDMLIMYHKWEPCKD